MASQTDFLKREAAKPKPNAINHPYSSQFKGLPVPPGPEKEEAAEGPNKYPRFPYEKLLMIADLLK
ncbi:MAG: hypothetical protein ABFD08_20465 [Syntrophomonas sp.]